MESYSKLKEVSKLSKGRLIRMLLLNPQQFGVEEREETGEELIKNLYLFHNQDKVRIDKLLFICEPNAGRFEFHAFDPSLIDSFLSNGYSLVMWNYAGYGIDDGFGTSLKVK